MCVYGFGVASLAFETYEHVAKIIHFVKYNKLCRTGSLAET